MLHGMDFLKALQVQISRVQKYVPPVSGKKEVAILKVDSFAPFMPDIETYLYNDDMYRPTAYPQQPGAWDYVQTNTDGTPKKYVYGSLQYYKLSNGEMIYTSNANIVSEAPPSNNKISSVTKPYMTADVIPALHLIFHKK